MPDTVRESLAMAMVFYGALIAAAAMLFLLAALPPVEPPPRGRHWRR